MLISYKRRKNWLFQPQKFRLVEQFHSILRNLFYANFYLFIKYELNRKLSFKVFWNILVKHKYYTAKLVLYIGLKINKNCFKLIWKISAYHMRNYLVILNYQLPLMGKPLPRYPRIYPPPPPFNSIVEREALVAMRAPSFASKISFSSAILEGDSKFIINSYKQFYS